MRVFEVKCWYFSNHGINSHSHWHLCLSRASRAFVLPSINDATSGLKPRSCPSWTQRPSTWRYSNLTKHIFQWSASLKQGEKTSWILSSSDCEKWNSLQPSPFIRNPTNQQTHANSSTHHLIIPSSIFHKSINLGLLWPWIHPKVHNPITPLWHTSNGVCRQSWTNINF